MKKLILSIIFASIVLTNVNAAPRKVEHNCYIQGTGSFGWHNKSKIKTSLEGSRFERSTSAKQKKGTGGAVAIGYILDCWRLELEGSHRHNATDAKSGIKSNTALMANLFCDIPVTDLISLYVGAGAGVASVNGKKIVPQKGDSKSSKFKKKHGHLDTVFAWQGMAGLSYAISDNVDLITGYRLFATAKPSFNTGYQSVKLKHKLKNIPLVHSVEIGLRFKF